MSLNYYPGLSVDQFELGCRALEERCHDNLGETNWLSIRWHDGELEIKQAGAVSGTNDLVSESLIGVDEMAIISYNETVDSIEDRDDEITIVRDAVSSDMTDRPAVDFSILLSPTYRVPVLWFRISATRAANIDDLEGIYRRVVNPGSHLSLRGVGTMGGISLANHPITDKPTFFIHPCNTTEAMIALNDGSKLDPYRYLLLWFGIVGAGVGLHVPSRVAAL